MLGLSLDPAWRLPAAASQPASRYLIMIQLAGGNDGLNMIVPYTDPLYRKARPTLAYRPDEVFKLSNTLGLNPAMGRLFPLYEQGNVAIVQGLGYAHRDRSHFVSTDIWQSAHAPPDQTRGWLGRLADAVVPADGVGDGCCQHPMTFGTLLPLALRAERGLGGCMLGTDAFELTGSTALQTRLRHIYSVSEDGDRETLRRLTEVGLECLDTMRAMSKRAPPPHRYPNTGFAQFLRLAAQMIADNLAPPVFHAIIGGFDTHAHQRVDQEQHLQYLADGISAFMTDLEIRGLDDRVLMATYSEFGRRVHENASHGTDHGTAAPHLIVGAAVKGGLHGTTPDLGHLENGDVPFSIDFRSYYATLLERWMQCSPQAVLGDTWPQLPVL